MLKKKRGHCASGLSAAQRPVISPPCCVQSHVEQYRWDCAAAQPTDAEQTLHPHAFCGFGSPFGLANLPSEIISIIRCIWIFLHLSWWRTVATRAQCCVIQQWAVTAPWGWQAFTLLVHQCPYILLAGFALTSLKITHFIVWCQWILLRYSWVMK